MLEHKKLLIDQDCPMCRAYGSAFTKLKLIDNRTVSPYQLISEVHASKIDMKRAKNEIAFYCTKSGEVKYGIDAMIDIIAQSSRRFKDALNFTPIYYIIKGLYSFVSYNRKVIAPATAKIEMLKCHPEASVFWNWAYILSAAIFTGFVLNSFVLEISGALGISHNASREYYVCLGQILWQAGFASLVRPTLARPKRSEGGKVTAYLGNMSTVSLIGALLLIPALIIYHALNLPVTYLITAFLIVVAIMLMEHVRRCRILELPNSFSLSWVVYRLLVLSLIALLN